jgi:ankyrin repeat protein
MWACRYGHVRVAKLLLATQKVDINAIDQDKRTPLTWALLERHQAAANALLDTGTIKLEARDELTVTAGRRCSEP